jgi:uncharacterized membrane protein
MEVKDKKGQAQLAPVFAMATFAILLIVGVMVYSNFDTQSAALLSSTSAAFASASNTSSNFYNGSNILSIGPVVLAAVIILAIVALLARR